MFTPNRTGLLIGGLAGALMLLMLNASLDNPFAGVFFIFLAGAVAFVAALGLDRAGTVLMVAALFTAPCNSLRPTAALPFVTWSDLLFVLGIGLLVPRLLRGRANIPTAYAVGAVLVLIAGLIACRFAGNPAISLNVFVRLIAASMMLPLAFILWNPKAKVIDLLCIAYIGGQMLSTFAALAAGKDPETGRFLGLTVHFNFFALCAVEALCLAFYLLPRLRPAFHPFVYGSMAVSSLAVVLSGSRAAFGALVVMVLLYPIFERSATKFYAVAVLGVLAIVSFPILAAVSGSESAIGRLNDNASAGTSNFLRVYLFKESWNAFVSRPIFGVGFERALDAQNIYLQVLSSAGVIGFLGFMLMCWAITRPLLDRTGPMHRLGYGAFAYLIQGVLTASLWDRMVWAGLSLAFLGVLWPASRGREAAEGIDPVRSKEMLAEFEAAEAEAARTAEHKEKAKPSAARWEQGARRHQNLSGRL